MQKHVCTNFSIDAPELSADAAATSPRVAGTRNADGSYHPAVSSLDKSTHLANGRLIPAKADVADVAMDSGAGIRSRSDERVLGFAPGCGA